MRRGSYSELEMNQTKAMIANHLRELQDSANEMIAFDFNTVLSRRERTAEQLMEQVQAVTAEQIAADSTQNRAGYDLLSARPKGGLRLGNVILSRCSRNAVSGNTAEWP